MIKTEEGELIEAARAARDKAYAPYSLFRVGAAVEAEEKVFAGCNVENASYGLTICAERSAVFAAIAGGYGKLRRIAISIDSPAGASANVVPCGACLQVLAEFMDRDGKVIIDGGATYRLDQLLPESFRLNKSVVE